MKKSQPKSYRETLAGDWSAEQREQAVEHAIAVVRASIASSLKATNGHAMPLAMILFKQSVALMLQSGWSADDVAHYGVSTIQQLLKIPDLKTNLAPEYTVATAPSLTGGIQIENDPKYAKYQ